MCACSICCDYLRTDVLAADSSTIHSVMCAWMRVLLVRHIHFCTHWTRVFGHNKNRAVYLALKSESKSVNWLDSRVSVCRLTLNCFFSACVIWASLLYFNDESPKSVYTKSDQRSTGNHCQTYVSCNEFFARINRPRLTIRSYIFVTISMRKNWSANFSVRHSTMNNGRWCDEWFSFDRVAVLNVKWAAACWRVKVSKK